MFGKMVEIDGVKVMVSCVPSTPYSEVLRRASEKVAEWEAAANHKQHAAEIASKFGIEYAR